MTSQVLNPLLASFEDSTPSSQIAQGLYENNWEYYSRNGLTSLAICVLSVYVVGIGKSLARELSKYKELRSGVRSRAILLTVIMEVALLLRLFMIWTQNWFWYRQSQTPWLFFTFTYQTTANILPLFGFMLVVCLQIRQLHKLNDIAMSQRQQKNRSKVSKVKVGLGQKERKKNRLSKVELETAQNELTTLQGSGQPSKLRTYSMQNVNTFGKYFVLTPQYDAIPEEAVEYSVEDVYSVRDPKFGTHPLLRSSHSTVQMDDDEISLDDAESHRISRL